MSGGYLYDDRPRAQDYELQGTNSTLGFGRTWPTTRARRVDEYTRRWEAFLGLAYRDGDIRRLNLFRARDSSDRIIAETRRLTRDLAFVAMVDAAAIATDGVAIHLDPEAPPIDEALVLRARECWTRSGVWHRLSQWALRYAVLGDIVIEGALDAQGRPIVVARDPRHVEIDMDAHGIEVSRAVVTLDVQPPTPIEPDGRYGPAPEKVRHRWVTTPDEVTAYVGDVRSTEDSGPNTLGVVPLMRVPFVDLGEPIGLWAGYGYEDALASIDSFATQMQALGTRHANPILKGLNVDPGDASEIGRMGRAAALPNGADLQWLEATLQGVQSLLAQAEQTRAAMVQTLPEFLFVDAGAASSGTALSYRAGAFVAKITPIRERFYRSLALATGYALALADGVPWSDDRDVLVVDGGSPIPQDRAALAALYRDLVDAGLMRRGDAVAKLQGLGVLPDGDPEDYAASALVEQSAGLEALGAAALRGLDTAPPVDVEEPGPDGSTGEVATDETE